MALTDNLISYWSMDEASGTRADSHGSNDLTDNNTVLSATGIINNGADFEVGNSEHLSITDAAQTGLDITGDIAIAGWVKYESLPSSGGQYWFLSKFGTSGFRQYAFALYNNSGTYQFSTAYSLNGTSTNTFHFKNWTPVVGTWYHIAIQYDVSAVTTEFFVDGSSLGTTTSGSVTSIANTSQPFYMGRLASEYTDAVYDEFGIWSRLLTSGEVSELYNGGAGLAYPFTGGGVVRNPTVMKWH